MSIRVQVNLSMDQSNSVQPRLAQMFVLNEIGDDYEHFARVRRGVVAMAERVERSITTKEICDAIVAVIRDGLARAYYLSPWAAPQEVASEVVASRMGELYATCPAAGSPNTQEDDRMLRPHEDAYEPDKLYFLATQDGLAALAAFDEWPSG
jgi:hypothetical protein